ncbi:MAG: FAD-dependent oxidoreductase [Marivibrio sp.]|uniref:oxidoreductase n=1 Tax=Marivibrio sp. TaxID=2039719 RepID=UPI0032EFC460
MSRDPRYDILFEPVQIGPVTAKNRFYQVPHCNGMGRLRPSSMAEMRGVKAEGGWAVVCTEEVEIHSTSDHSPVVEGRIWDDDDLPMWEKMTAKIHEHGGLAGFQPNHSGYTVSNLFTREIPLAPVDMPVEQPHPVQARAMDKADIKALRKWYVDAARRAKRAGFDIIYDYCGHNMSQQMHFLSRRINQRTDEYGGSLENRVRLFREVLEDMKDAVGDTCAIAVRFAVDEMMGEDGLTSDGEARDVIGMLAELPDLWDVNVSEWSNDSATSRFAGADFQGDYTAFVKSLTSKPVVGVGRFTSPDMMVSLIKKGRLDLIGAARPSIADPFLPKKIEEGRIEDIRECIGCNICVTGDFTVTPIRCTQNPTMGEEWRKGWHPERIPEKKSDASVLIVGAGPAGLEAARALGQRGYAVTLAEASGELGGRVVNESKLPGLTEWIRVRDHRQWRLEQMGAVDVFLESALTAEQIMEFGVEHVAVATGAHWRKDGVGRALFYPVDGLDDLPIYTPDDLMAGRLPEEGPVVVYDDDHYYMGGLMAEVLDDAGRDVIFATPEGDVSTFTHNTMEQHRIQRGLLERGVDIRAHRTLSGLEAGGVRLACTYTGREERVEAAAIVMVTARLPDRALYDALSADPQALEKAGIKSVVRIGDCLAPGTIAAAVYAGHRYAREFDATPDEGLGFRRELPRLADA